VVGCGRVCAGDEKKWGKLSFWAWTVGLLFALVLDVVKYRENSRRQQKALASSSQVDYQTTLAARGAELSFSHTCVCVCVRPSWRS
jgi:heme/copper-type cytochrome/quinol oxidase subunit 1